MATIGQRVREVRESKRPKLSTGKLAARVGLSPQALTAIELHGAIPKSDNLRALAVELGVSADYLLDLPAPATPEESAAQAALDAVRGDDVSPRPPPEAERRQTTRRATD